jgi:hypothetical protein
MQCSMTGLEKGDLLNRGDRMARFDCTIKLVYAASPITN